MLKFYLENEKKKTIGDEPKKKKKFVSLDEAKKNKQKINDCSWFDYVPQAIRCPLEAIFIVFFIVKGGSLHVEFA